MQRKICTLIILFSLIFIQPCFAALEAAWLNEAVVGTGDDLTANNNDGTAYGLVWENVGADFDGTDDYIDTNNTFQATFQDSFTICAWIKPDDGKPTSGDKYFGSRNGTGQDEIYFEVTSTGYLQTLYKSNNNIAEAKVDWPLFQDGQEEWHYCVGTFDSTTNGVGGIKLYFDGIKKGLLSGDPGDTSGIVFADFVTTENIWLGVKNSAGTGDDYFGGEIKDVRIYSEVKSPDWILNEYQKSIPDDDLIAWTPDGIQDISRYERSVTYASQPVTGDWSDLDGTDDYVALGDIGNVQQIQMWIEPNTTTEEIIFFKAGNDILLNAGTIEYTGVTEVNTYINGVDTNTMVADVRQFLVCQFSTVDSDSTEIGFDGTGYGDIKFRDFRAYDSIKTEEWILQEYRKTKVYQ